MIEDVIFATTKERNAPKKFEAGTPYIVGAAGLGAALDHMQRAGRPGIAAYDHALLEEAQAGLAKVRGWHLIGTARAKPSVLSFTIDGHENGDVAQHVDRHAVDQPVRASPAFSRTEYVAIFFDAQHALPQR